MTPQINRRKFLGAAAVTGAFTIVPRHVLGGQGRVAPNDKITLAHIGMGTQGFSELGGLLENPALQIVSVCDPNRDSQNYIEWGKNSIRNRIREYLGNPTWREGTGGCPGGREVGREVVETWYAKNRGTDRFKGCSLYADFRELFEKEKDIDAVKIMTPDHLHATIALAAMKSGKHVMVHKPIANRLREGRLVLETARQTGRATHLLAYGAGDGNAAIARQVLGGAIGKLREIHNWTNRPVWPQYPELPTDRPAPPPGFDWNLWLGPERDRPYHPHYTHTVFRGWYDFGGGSMADMGIYSLWPIFATLDLPSPVSAQAWASHTCTIVDQTSRTVDNTWSFPAACSLRFRFPAGRIRPALDLFWYDGGMKPRLPDEVETHAVAMEREGILFVGEEGSILAGFQGQEPRRFRGGKVEPLTVDSADEESSREARWQPWVRAVQGGDASPGNFLNAAAITDAVNLGTVALRAGRKVEFDAQAMRITNHDSANRFLTRDYREGWEL